MRGVITTARQEAATCTPLTYTFAVIEFRETALFTRAVTTLLTDAEYAELQTSLVLDPEAGDLIPDTGGLRKLRWQQSKRSKGKRGGVRVIYYWHRSGPLIYMLLAYSKGEKDDLSQTEKRVLRQLVREEFK